MKFSPLIRFLTAALAAHALVVATHACSVCGCSLSSDWATLGYATMAGGEASLRFEYFDQVELHTGAHQINRATLPLPNDNEIQQRTLNRNLWLDLDWVGASAWALRLSAPYHDRFHTTIAEGDTEISTSHARGLGDARLLARRTLFRNLHQSWSVQFGLKLPTGRFDQDFSAGPRAGDLLDRGLQLGTGTTDLLAGVSWFGRPATALGAFAQATFSQPLAKRAGFLPSTSLTVSGGLRWLNSSRITPQLQLNAKFEGREHGVEGDTANSGSTTVHLSPGLTAEIDDHSSAFVFVQLPVHQRYNGLQLAPSWILSTGLRWKF